MGLIKVVAAIKVFAVNSSKSEPEVAPVRAKPISGSDLLLAAANPSLILILHAREQPQAGICCYLQQIQAVV